MGELESNEKSRSRLEVSRVGWGLLLAVLVLVGLSERYSARYAGHVVDDAMTSMQYAKQLASGNGLVFNVNERVEGYTNFAWVLVMTPIYWLSTMLGLDFVALVVQLGVVLSVATLVLVGVIGVRKWGAGHLAPWLSLALCAVDPGFSSWAVLGLEVHLLAFFMVLALYFLEASGPRRALYFGACLLGAHLTRPDAGLFCATFLGSELLEAALAWRRGERAAGRARAMFAVTSGAVWVVGYGIYFVWRYRYFGQLLPNTFYLKLGGGNLDAWARGFDYLRSFLNQRGFVPVLSLLAVFAFRDPWARGLLVYNLLHSAYVVYVGGDFFPHHRFFAPEIPLLALATAAGAANIFERAQRSPFSDRLARLGVNRDWLRGAGVMSALYAVLIVFQRGIALGPSAREVRAWGQETTQEVVLYSWLRKQLEPGDSVATCLIGHVGFYSNARVIDVCGVIDPFTAHRTVKDFGKGTAGHEKIASTDYIMKQHPTYVGIRVLRGDLTSFGYILRGDLPDDTFEAIWQRDPLLETGQFLEDTRIGFNDGPPPGWRAVGDAFERFPAPGRWQHQGELEGADGPLINSFNPSRGTAATGTLTSPPFDLTGDLLVLRLAGGRDPRRLHVDLLVGDELVGTATGRDGDMLSRRSFDIAKYRGHQATLRIVDEATEAWGFLAVDEIVQWREGRSSQGAVGG